MNNFDLIDDLAEKTGKLRAAMHSSNVAAIENATEEFRNALVKVKAVGLWTADPALKQRIVDLLPELEESRMLACLLADMTGQLNEIAAARAGNARQNLYKRNGARAG